MIRKLPNGKYQVQSEKGRNLGTYDSKAKAEERLKEVEMFKHMKRKALINICKSFKLAGEDELADKISCALSALAGTKKPRHELSYSYVMRKLRKGHPDKVRIFQEAFKKTFDDAMDDELESPEELALMAGLKAIDIEIT